MDSEKASTTERVPTPYGANDERREGDSDNTVGENGGEEKLEGPSDAAPESDYPEGGARAWAVAYGSSLAIFSTFGYVNALGVFQEYYVTHQLREESPSAISWIGSLQIFFLFSGALFGGPLFDMYGEKILWAAAPPFVASVFITSWCKEYYQFMLAQGILGGLAMGMAMAPCFAASSQYFNKKRGAAMGLAVAGSSLGGVIWPIALNKMLTNSSLTFGWSIRICGFIMAALLAVAMVGIKARLPPRKGAFFLLGAFKQPTYVTIILAVWLMMVGMMIPIFYLPTYAVEQGMSTQLSNYLVSILNAASFFGRVIPGIMADKLGPLNMLFMAGTSAAILIFCWQKCVSNASLIVFAGLYGFCSGAIVSLMSVALSRCAKNPQQIGTYMGMGMFFVSFASLIGPPISGAFLSHYHGFKEVAIFNGVLTLVGAFTVLIAKKTTEKGIFGKV